jgi:chain length determinant protein EpsF
MAILGARKWVALATLLFILGATAAASILLPKTYTATASVLLDAHATNPLTGSTSLSMQLYPAYMATQVDVIASPRVARLVIGKLKIANNPEVQRQFREDGKGEGSIETWLVDALRKKLNVKPGRESSIIEVSFSGADPRYAATLANAFAEAYLQTNLELKVDPASHNSAWFESQVQQLRKDLEQARERLSTFQKDHAIVGSDDRMDVENVRLNELSSQLVIAETQSADSSSRQAQAHNRAGTSQEIISNPLIHNLKSELSRHEGRRIELAQKLGVNHPQLVELDAEIRALRSKLEAETKSISSSVDNTARVSQRRESELRAAVATQKAKVLRLRQDRDRVAQLTREVDNAQRSFDSATLRLDQARLESKSSQTEAAVLDPAFAPLQPSSPRLVLNMIVAAVVGTMLSLAIAFFAEMRHRRLRSIDDLREIFQLPMLGKLPLHSFSRGRRARRTVPRPVAA